MKKRKIGEVPPGKIMVLDPQGRLRDRRETIQPRLSNNPVLVAPDLRLSIGSPTRAKGKNGERDSWSFPK